MAKIKQLPPQLANIIAAGEVVERPASVVKELVENSCDAGATAITAEIKNGGISFIRVTDNGCGISRDDVETAFLRHATSKISTARDLECIGTLGFRGEALAAVAAVSHIDLLTMTADESIGTALSLEAGKVVSKNDAACPVGTTIIVRDLFFNTPARFKFLKKDSAEAAAVHSTLQKLALSRPELSIKYIRDGKEEFYCPGDGNLMSAIYSVLGRDFSASLIPVSYTTEDVEISGFVSSPSAGKGSRGGQHFFVNGRCIKSQSLASSLEAAYKNRLLVGKFPACVLHIKTALSSVDVNVHPAKTEVKFFSEQRINSAVYHAAALALDGEATITSLSAEKSSPAWETSLSPSAPVPAPKPPVKQPEEIQTSFILRQSPLILYKSEEDLLSLAPAKTEAPVSEIKPSKDSQPVEKPALFEEAPEFRLIGEAMNTYIIIEQNDTLLLIDKHAAHERIIFDRLKAANEPPLRQLLLSPEVISLTPEEHAVITDNIELLSELGFEAENFGGSSFIVRQIPENIDLSDAASLIASVAAQLLNGAGKEQAKNRDEILHSVACKAAIKAGSRSTPAELEALALRVLSGEIKYCPHGRPVAVELSRSSIEKQFKRRV